MNEKKLTYIGLFLSFILVFVAIPLWLIPGFNLSNSNFRILNVGLALLSIGIFISCIKDLMQTNKDNKSMKNHF